MNGRRIFNPLQPLCNCNFNPHQHPSNYYYYYYLIVLYLYRLMGLQVLKGGYMRQKKQPTKKNIDLFFFLIR